MYYFRFEIPTNADGTRVSYSPNWHGEMPRCPKDVVVDLYNDKEGWGLAHTEDNFIPKEVAVLTEKEASLLITEAKDEDGVYFGDKLANRWNPKAEVKEVEPDTNLSIDPQPVGTKAVFCPICHQFIMYFPKNIIAKTINLTCPNGHTVTLTGGG